MAVAAAKAAAVIRGCFVLVCVHNTCLNARHIQQHPHTCEYARGKNSRVFSPSISAGLPAVRWWLVSRLVLSASRARQTSTYSMSSSLWRSLRSSNSSALSRERFFFGVNSCGHGVLDSFGPRDGKRRQHSRHRASCSYHATNSSRRSENVLRGPVYRTRVVGGVHVRSFLRPCWQLHSFSCCVKKTCVFRCDETKKQEPVAADAHTATSHAAAVHHRPR